MPLLSPSRIRLLLATLGAIAALGCGDAPPANDAAPWHGPEAEQAEVEIVRSSYYVPMRDGTELAVDVYLPAGRTRHARLPTLVHQTRYWRGAELRWPLGLVADGPRGRAAFFPSHGWAMVSADVRGTGASFGTRSYPWGREEIRDGADIAAWVRQQPWSNGDLATDGISYSGTSAEFLASQAPEGLLAATPRFSLVDAYTDITYPGGVPFDVFAEAWPTFNRALDANRMPEAVPWLFRLMARGVRPVDPARLSEAVRQHEGNGDVTALSRSGIHRDALFPDGNDAEDISPVGHVDSLRAAAVPLYSWSGWFDGAYARAAIQRHLTLGTPGSRLILGPWGHAGEVSGSPTSPGASAFEANRELLRFFDHHVRGRATGIEQQPPVLYYTMVEDRWKGAASWPPPADAQRWYLGAGGVLSRERTLADDASDEYRVDYTARTGTSARWDSLMEPQNLHYEDREREDDKLLVYTSAALTAPIEVTGHAVVELFVASTATDGAFFAYLEDVAPDGSVTYVTEGLLRALQRNVSSSVVSAIPGVPARSYATADARPLAPGRVAELRFELLPVSYLFREGHAIRLALAGADADHFGRIPAEGDPVWTVFRDAPHPSRVILPVAVGPASPVISAVP